MDFSLVGGYTRQKQQLLRIRRLDRYRGTLLYGPPGNGKTLLAQTLAGELKIRLIKLSLDKLVKGYVGESEKQIKRHFEEARKQPTLLFIDEFESLFQRRETNDLATKAYAQLVYELDRTDNVHLICCTNHRHLIDPGLLQSGRIDNHVYIGNPTPEDRHAIFDKLLSSVHLQKNVDLDQLVVKSENQSVSYLKEWTRQASLLAVSENCILSNAHFDRLNSF
ncbi:P-loop containing nucleoside triphosphate hydrolase protein [Gorgonomyces haynaldii]|nr:P-loop containing nucleoside triphosphate hydrolase protein [Gorgonomyces haynaldii]